MSDDANKQALPPFTFGIRQVFDSAFSSGQLAFPGHYLIYASTGVFRLEVSGIMLLLLGMWRGIERATRTAAGPM